MIYLMRWIFRFEITAGREASRAVAALLGWLLFACCALPTDGYALSSANIPLDSPVYFCLEKLAGFGLISSDIKGIRPLSKSEAVRLAREARQNLANMPNFPLAQEFLDRIQQLLPRETSLLNRPEKRPLLFDYNPAASLRMRYVYLEGAPRSYERDVHDPGGEGVFGIGAGLRPDTPYPHPVRQHGTEGTPLLENNNGVIHVPGHSGELRWAIEGYVSGAATALLEPSVLATADDAVVRLNRGYLKLGGGALELELGKDENWFGLGYRGNITLTNNAVNFTSAKLSSPEPFRVGWLSLLGDLKYALLVSRFAPSDVAGQERQPLFVAVKLSAKPAANFEIGLNMGRQVGGPGVKNGILDVISGAAGGSGADNSNGLAGIEMRYRLAHLRNTEIYGEFSGEDTAGPWPIVESYVAGFFIPRLTADGRNDLRFEFFQGNQILYTHNIFAEGYLNKSMPIGHSQGGATQDFFMRYSHWFSARNNLALEFIYTNRGMIGRMPGQAVERVYGGRALWNVPIHGDVDALLGYGAEKIANLNLVGGQELTNHLVRVELRYRY